MQTPHAPCRLLVADDHPVLARLLSDFFRGLPGVTLVGTAHDGRSAVDACMAQQVDVLVLDLGLPNMGGLEVLAALKAANARVRTLVFSALVNERTVASAFENGALGFLEKSAPFDELEDAIARVSRGEPYLGAAVRPIIATLARQRFGGAQQLTQTELHILRQMNAGHSLKVIARELNMSVSGVYKAVGRTKEKLGASTTADLFFAGLRLGVTVDPVANP